MKPFNGTPATTKRRGTLSYGLLASNASATGTVTFAAASLRLPTSPSPSPHRELR